MRHDQTLRLGAQLEGDTAAAEDVLAQVTWQDMEIRSMAQAVDALGKAATMLQIPVRALWSRIPGVTKNDVDEWIAQRMALLGGRLTIDHTVQSSDRIGGYRRVGRGDSCPWCKMLIGRGAVYKSEQTAGGAREYHDHCNCQPEPWYGDDVHQDAPPATTPAQQVAADDVVDQAAEDVAPPAVPIAERDLTALDDDELSDLLATAQTDEEVDAVVAELDRRDTVEQAARKAEADRQKRAAARAAKREAKYADLDAEYDRRLAAGDDPESAYADVFGVSVEQQRRDQAIASLRSNGYSGRNFEELSRAAYRDYVEETYFHAEAATRGRLLNGTRGNLDTRDTRKLFTGTEAYARANASEELLTYWQQHGRLTFTDYQSSLLGGALRLKAVASWA
jgi:hypothetical protein